MKSIKIAGVGLMACLMASSAFAQPPAAPPAGGAPAAPAAAPLAPNYVTIIMEITVNKSAADTWARVGRYCAIGEWLQIAAGCTIVSGKEGDIGSVRSVGGEIMVGKTALSYTYAQRPSLTNPTAAGRYNMYHGCLEAVPLTATTSKLVYTLMYDNEFVAGDDAAKQTEMNGRRTTFTNALNNMKILAEGGTLPPPPARGGGGGGRGGGAPGGAPPAGGGRGG